MIYRSSYLMQIATFLIASGLAYLTQIAGESHDMAVYVDYYVYSCDIGIVDFLLDTRKEPVFSIFIYYFGALTSCNQIELFKFIITLVGLLFVGFGAYSLGCVFVSSVYSLTLAVLVITFPILLEGSAHLVRQIWGIGLSLLLIRFNKPLLILLSAGIHLTSLLFLPLLIAVRDVKRVVFAIISFGFFVASFLALYSELSEVTSDRLVGLTESIGFVHLGDLSMVAYLVIATASVGTALVFKRYFGSTDSEQVEVLIRFLMYSTLVLAVIIISIGLDFNEMQVRMMYYLYPIAIIVVGIELSNRMGKWFLWLSCLAVGFSLGAFYFRNSAY